MNKTIRFFIITLPFLALLIMLYSLFEKPDLESEEDFKQDEKIGDALRPVAKIAKNKENENRPVEDRFVNLKNKAMQKNSDNNNTQKELKTKSNDVEDDSSLESGDNEIDSRWKKSVEKLFTQDLKLPTGVFIEYEKMQRSFYDEVASFLSSLQSEGEFAEGISIENIDLQLQELKTHYQQRLKQTIGEDHYQKYEKLKDEFNHELLKEQDPSIGTMTIEF